MTSAQRETFEDQGYVAIEDLFEPERDLDPLVDEYKGIMDRLAKELVAKGEISTTYADLPFVEQLARVQHESGANYSRHFDIALPKRGVKEDSPFSVGPAVFHMLRSDALLDAVEALIGPEIYANPIQHVRLKQPLHLLAKDPNTGRGRSNATTWHQDNAFMMPEADETEVVTVWFSLQDVGVENGCLQLIPYSHREGLVQHCRPDVSIPDRLVRIEQAVPVPLKRGSALFMHRCMQHASLPNRADTVRWSFDVRYNPTSQPSGREVQPGFVARSRSRPETELRDHREWSELWYRTRKKLVGQTDLVYERWGDAEEPGCA